MKKFNYILENDIFRNSSQKDFGILRGDFDGLGVQMTTLHPAG